MFTESLVSDEEMLIIKLMTPNVYAGKSGLNVSSLSCLGIVKISAHY